MGKNWTPIENQFKTILVKFEEAQDLLSSIQRFQEKEASLKKGSTDMIKKLDEIKKEIEFLQSQFNILTKSIR